MWVRKTDQLSQPDAQKPYRRRSENQPSTMMIRDGEAVTDPCDVVANLPNNHNDQIVHTPNLYVVEIHDLL